MHVLTKGWCSRFEALKFGDIVVVAMFETCRYFLDTPLKINMEHNYEGLEDDFPFQLGGFLGSMLIFSEAHSEFQVRLSKGSEKLFLLSLDTAIREIYPLLDLSFISARVFIIYTYACV